ncbi:hypothetical protein TNCV_785511 [Trichonephila clavipes]|nr:hypothetical protein TNCV_785511 [Trichonephila clavipes]
MGVSRHIFDDRQDTVGSQIRRQTLYVPSPHDFNLIEPSTSVIWLGSVKELVAGGSVVVMNVNFALSEVCEWSWWTLKCGSHI